MDTNSKMRAITAEYTSYVSEQLDSFKEENPPEKIKQDTLNVLEKAKEEILRKLLGFDYDSWGVRNWKLDHCNGRAGESAAGDYIRTHQKEAVDAWLRRVDLGVEAITKDMEDSMIQEFRSKVISHFKKQVDNLAKEKATKIVEELINNNSMDAILDLDNLID